MSHFFSRLSYSFGNEDWRSEREALKIKAEDRVLCITASGDRPLHLLLDECKEIVAVDANPIQNHLLSLKCAAMEKLTYPEYLEFLGAAPSHHRANSLKKILPYMEEEAQKYWVKQEKMVDKGILYQGALEKFCQDVLAPGFKIMRGKKINQLFEFDDIEEQRNFVVQSWDKFYWRKIFDVALNSFMSRLVLRALIGDPGLYDHLNGSVSIGTYIYKRMNNSLMENLAKESLLFSIILKGNVKSDAYPPYLTENGISHIKKRLNRITLKNNDIITYLESVPDQSFDCFSLSDVASYLSQQDFIKLLKQVKRVAKPEARFSIRQFLSNHKVPEDLQKVFCRDEVLEKKLEKEDRCFVYRFMAGKINSCR